MRCLYVNTLGPGPRARAPNGRSPGPKDMKTMLSYDVDDLLQSRFTPFSKNGLKMVHGRPSIIFSQFVRHYSTAFLYSREPEGHRRPLPQFYKEIVEEM